MMKETVGATGVKMGNGHMQCGEILDDWAQIVEFVEHNETQQVQHHGGIEEEGFAKMRTIGEK